MVIISFDNYHFDNYHFDNYHLRADKTCLCVGKIDSMERIFDVTSTDWNLVCSFKVYVLCLFLLFCDQVIIVNCLMYNYVTVILGRPKTNNWKQLFTITSALILIQSITNVTRTCIRSICISTSLLTSICIFIWTLIDI